MAIKTFSIDWDSFDDLNKMFNQIKSRKCEIDPKREGSKRQYFKALFDACSSIWNTDISSLYKDMGLDGAKEYYVYAHMASDRPIAIGKDGRTTFFASLGPSHIPFYVGKGIGERFQNTTRNETHRKVKQKLASFGHTIIASKVVDGLTEIEALCYESKLIDIFGLLGKGGILVNLDEGVKAQERRALYKEHFLAVSNVAKQQELLSLHKSKMRDAKP